MCTLTSQPPSAKGGSLHDKRHTMNFLGCWWPSAIDCRFQVLASGIFFRVHCSIIPIVIKKKPCQCSPNSIKECSCMHYSIHILYLFLYNEITSLMPTQTLSFSAYEGLGTRLVLSLNS